MCPVGGDVKIRPGKPEDAEAIGDVFLGAFAEMTYLPVLHTEAETRAFIRDVLLPNNEVWVAEEDGRLIGFAGLGDDVLRHLWVRPEAQNRGVGSALLALAKASSRWIEALGLPEKCRRTPLL